MTTATLNQIDDSTLIQEAANRLLKRFRIRHGIDMKYGGFNFVIHEGKFFQVEDLLKDKSFFSEDYENTSNRRRRH